MESSRAEPSDGESLGLVEDDAEDPLGPDQVARALDLLPRRDAGADDEDHPVDVAGEDQRVRGVESTITAEPG